MAQAIEIEVPEELSSLRLPEGVQRRLQQLLDKQDAGTPLSPDEKSEAEGLVDLSEWLSLLRLRVRRLKEGVRDRPSSRATSPLRERGILLSPCRFIPVYPGDSTRTASSASPPVRGYGVQSTALRRRSGGCSLIRPFSNASFPGTSPPAKAGTPYACPLSRETVDEARANLWDALVLLC